MIEAEGLKILLIEDDEDDFLLVRDYLSQIPHSSYDLEWISECGAAREEMYRSRHDLYLVDYRLGELNGLDLLREAIDHGCTVPIVVLTGQGNFGIDLEAMKLGAADYLSKDQVNANLLDRSIRYAIERSRSERSLQLSEKKYRSIYDNSSEGIFQISPGGCLIDVNPAFARIFGYDSPDQMLSSVGDFRKSCVVPRDLRLLGNAIQEAGGAQGFETQMFTRSGSKIHISIKARAVRNADGETVYYEGSIDDITERKQAEQAIQALFESTVGIIGEDFFDRIAARLCSWLGCDCVIVGEIVDSKISVLSMIVDGVINRDYSYDLEALPCCIVVKEGYRVYPDRVCELFPEGKFIQELRAVGFVGIPLKNRSGEPIGVLCAFSRQKLDIPRSTEQFMSIIAARASAEVERSRLEKEQKKMEAQLRQAQKMEAIGTLAGGIAHDFNNILGIILGYTEVTLRGLPENSIHQENLRGVRNAGLRAKDLIRQILSFSRMSEKYQQPINLSPIIKEGLKLLKAALPTTITINEFYQADDNSADVVLGDPTQIHQILMNLCTNAFHAMKDKGGTLDVILSDVYFSSYDIGRPTDLAPGAYVRLTVSDTGHGMSADVVERIFEPYFTTKGGEGSGLGLAVVHGIVKSHEGTITVYSEPGQGTTFKVYLPKLESVIASETESVVPLPKGTECVLLVDDEEGLIKSGTYLLEFLGYKVVSSRSSAHALELFRLQPDNFNVVITDMTMPEMTGIDLAGRILHIRPDMPIVLCTGFSEKIASELASSTGIKEYLTKPLEIHSLAQTVRKVLDQRSSLK